MNKEILPQVVLGITVGLLVLVAAAYRTRKEPTPGVLRRGGMAALLVYAVIAAPVFVRGGMTLLGLLLLVIVMALAIAAMSLARSRYPTTHESAQNWVRAAVGTALAAVILIAAGQTLALLGMVDPRVVVLAIVVIAGLIVAAQGLAGSSRAGSVAMWLMIVPIVIWLALGLFLGGPGDLVPPLIITPGPSALEVLGLAVAVVMLGWSDNGLAALAQAGAWTRNTILRVFGGAMVVVVLIGIGMLMFLGGAVLAPSLQFFVVPANLDLVPGLAAVVLAIMTVAFGALVASTLTGVGALGQPSDAVGAHTGVSARWVTISACVAAILALADPASGYIVTLASLVAAALVGAQLGGNGVARGAAVGVVVAVIAAVALGITGSLALGGATVIATAVVVVVGAIAARAGNSSTSEAVPQPAGK